MTTATQIFSIIISLVILGIYLPLSLYGIFIFLKYRYHVIIRKRHPQITLIICILLIITIICEGIRAPVKSFHHEWEWWFFHPVSSCLATTGCWLTLKLYLNYYDIHYANAIISSEWKKIINPTSLQNWFILNKNRYGSIKFWNIPLIILTILNVFAAYIWELIYPHNIATKLFYVNTCALLVSLICIIIMTIIRCKTPKFHDIFYQRKEIICIIRPTLIAIIYIVISLCIRGILPKNDIAIQDINQLFVFLAFATLSVWIIFTTTIGVLKKNKHWLKLIKVEDANHDDKNVNAYHVATTSMALETELTLKSINSTSATTTTTRTMQSVLNDEKGFEALLFHSAQEFSSEIILCLIELTQFQQIIYKYYMQQNYEINNNENGLCKEYWLIMPLTVPQSLIVYGDINMDGNDMDKCTELMQRAFVLYEKYIEIGSEFEINISGDCRGKIIEFFENRDNWIFGNNQQKELKRIYEIFQESMDELLWLLHSLFNRFKDSALFDQLYNN